MSDFLGTTLRGRYRLDALLGEGGMGAVYTAIDLQLDRKVAVKMLHSHLATHGELVARFLREARAVGRIGHSNIVQISDAYPVVPADAASSFVPNGDGEVFLVMEHLSGTTLGGLIEREGRIDAKRLVRIALQLLSALAAAHRAGIVHRDIKPENIFLTSISDVTDVVKVLDFGIAKLKEEESSRPLTQAGAIMGTPAYMSPEQVRGEPADQRADIYAVGACMYHALSGQLPFNAASLATMMVAVLHEEPRPLSSFGAHVPPALIPIIEKALAKDRAARYQTADAMSDALARFQTTLASVPLQPPSSASKLPAQDRTASLLAVPMQVTQEPQRAQRGSVLPTSTPFGSPPGSYVAPPQAPYAPQQAAQQHTSQQQSYVPQQQHGHAPPQGYPPQQGYPQQPPQGYVPPPGNYLPGNNAPGAIAPGYPQNPYGAPPQRAKSNVWIWVIVGALVFFGGCMATCVAIGVAAGDGVPEPDKNE